MTHDQRMGWPAARLVQMAFEEDCAMEQMLCAMHEATLRGGSALRPWALGIPERITAQQRANVAQAMGDPDPPIVVHCAFMRESDKR